MQFDVTTTLFFTDIMFINSPFSGYVPGSKPLNMSEAKGDLVMTQNFLLFKCKLLCYHAN